MSAQLLFAAGALLAWSGWLLVGSAVWKALQALTDAPGVHRERALRVAALFAAPLLAGRVLGGGVGGPAWAGALLLWKHCAARYPREPFGGDKDATVRVKRSFSFIRLTRYLFY